MPLHVVALTVQAEGADIRTVEGLADGDRLHPLHEAFARRPRAAVRLLHPRFLMLLAGALAEEPDLDRDERRLDEVLASNLCRCTGYAGIRRAGARLSGDND
ncbi:2Fe-2S iron-sulfur cluster-binding protein [Nonomuraea sp. CA-141351]|uniref:2Fe-2S iron-sulfur cluster-binding protein n=1 Tax=Nonomuraea sp. CA-141351 TaxID=3239996 RepID=UPI003D8F2ABC